MNQTTPPANSAQLQPRNRRSNDALVFDPTQLIEALLKRLKMITAVVLLSLLIGGTYLSMQKPEYTATAMIQLNTGERPLLDTESLLLGSSQDKAAIQSELDILQSPELAQRVIDELKLDTKDEFNPSRVSHTKLGRAKRYIAGLFNQANEAKTEDPEAQSVRVINAIQRRLNLKRDPLSYTVRISFTSVMPERAKNIANAFAQEYLRFQIDTNEESSRRANAWLSKRVNELRADVIKSERAVQAFSEANNLLELDGKTLDGQQLSELNSQLVEARSEFAQAEARLAQSQKLLKSGSGIGSVPEVLSSVLIQKLREQEAELVRERSELSGHFGPKHPRMENINGELRDLRGKISSETRKIVKGIDNELAISKVRIQSLEQSITAMQGRVGAGSKQDIELSELKREAEANRTLYQAFLSRLKETGEAINLEQTNTKIIARAQLPLNPSKPDKTLIMALFGLLGMMLGVTMAFLLEYLSRGFSTLEQVENAAQIQAIGMVPETPKNTRKILAELAADSSSSIYTESLRRILVGLQFSSGEKPPRSVLILSSLPQEGKGWLASSLARVMASSGKKVLLIDCDLHKRSLSDDFGFEPKKMLNDYLEGNAEIADTITRDEETGLDVIGSVNMQDHLQQHLESKAIQKLMDFAHKNYDTVFIDAPPVIGLSDVFFLSRLVDTSLFVIQWSKTPRKIVANALRILNRARITIAGCVLTQVDIQHYKKQEFGSSGFKKYGEYYQDHDPKSDTKRDKDKVVKLRA